ncbi:hypothetical protein MVEN_01024900 [Mycena venus]|uniref:SH3 domain-containing protein n=1 Tax=Mycena venus TaxID=2733690 RepID=A0A8H7D2R2_9AGAR|nr:hypothetical protein MVEN_01024900 [Mycena venus]
MSPLANQEPRASLISWWSDSNPGLQGPTINLHTAAKPLMKWMYYRQAVDIIKKRRGRPLSSETLEIYSSYLPLNYVSWATKAAIWAELADRATSQDDARAVVDSHIFPYIVQMLWSPDPRPRSWSCSLLGRLASHESTAPAILELKPCVQLTDFLHDKNSDVVREAMYALAQIARRIEGAQAIVEAKTLDQVLKLLESPNPDIRGMDLPAGWEACQSRAHCTSHLQIGCVCAACVSYGEAVSFCSGRDSDFLISEEDSDVIMPSFKRAQYVPPEISAPILDIKPPPSSLQQAEHDPTYSQSEESQFSPAKSEFSSSMPPEAPSMADSSDLISTPALPENSGTLKSFKVSLDDPTWKVLPAALKKYRINNDTWENYAMFICYGSTDNRIERCLSYNEKPLLLFRKLKDAKKNPVFMLKHIKDIRSPIAVAQQKHAARKAPFIMANGSATTSSTPSTSSPSLPQPLKLEVDLNAGQGAAAPTMNPAPAWSGHESPKRLNVDSDDVTPNTSREMPPVSASEVSYAIAIYPYMAEQEDELDVVVGDTFIILSRARGCRGWVPAGCLLETKVPVASAIAEATAAEGSGSGPSGSDSPPETPILPLSIISRNFPGIALMDYEKKREEELNLVKDDALRVFKWYNHWSYAVKEGGDRGWVPSWFIGKASTGPSTSVPSLLTSSIMEDTNQAQVSPMSPAFPAVQTGSSVAIIQHPQPF